MPRPADLLRIACGVGLVAWLLWQAASGDTLERLTERPPRGDWLAASGVLIVVALLLAFTRWRFVARAAGIDLSIAEAVRLGAVGFALNFVALGNVGGDVVKAALAAKPRPGSRTLAVTTVVIDRLMGLFGLLLLASVAATLGGDLASPPSASDSALITTADTTPADTTLAEEPSTALGTLRASTLIATATLAGGFAALLAPARWWGALVLGVGRWPVVGRAALAAGRVAAAYRRGRLGMATALVLGLAADAAFIGSFYAASLATPLEAPGATAHLLVTPLAMIAGALPISPNGLGTIEAATDLLYRAVDPATAVGVGTVVALTHRLAMLAVGVLAAAYYFLSSGKTLGEAVAESGEST